MYDSYCILKLFVVLSVVGSDPPLLLCTERHSEANESEWDDITTEMLQMLRLWFKRINWAKMHIQEWAYPPKIVIISNSLGEAACPRRLSTYWQINDQHQPQYVWIHSAFASHTLADKRLIRFNPINWLIICCAYQSITSRGLRLTSLK